MFEENHEFTRAVMVLLGRRPNLDVEEARLFTRKAISKLNGESYDLETLTTRIADRAENIILDVRAASIQQLESWGYCKSL